MHEHAALPVALLWGTSDDVDELREVLRDAGADIVFESDTANCSTQAILAAAPRVVLINLSASHDDESPLLEELAAMPELRVVFNDASITSVLSGWDRARWRRHLSAKILDREVDFPPRPDDAPALRLPRDGNAAFGAGGTPVVARSEQAAEADMDQGLASIADAKDAGPPPAHDWASELEAVGGTDMPLDSPETRGVAQSTMGSDMEPPIEIVLDAALELNEAEREVLGNLQAFDADGALDIVPPETIDRAGQQVDLKIDESARAGVQVGDFPANDFDAPLGGADEDLRLHAEVTSDEAMPVRLEAPTGFAELSLEPLDAPGKDSPALALPPVTSAPVPVVESSFASTLALESTGGPPIKGRARFEIDTTERTVSDLSASTVTPVESDENASMAAPDVWLLLGGRGSEAGMLQLLGALPPELPVSFVVLIPKASAGRAAELSIEAWTEQTALAPGQVVLLDMTTEFFFDGAGKLLRTAKKASRLDVLDTALGKLAALYGPRVGVVLFEGQGLDGSAGLARIIALGGTVWSATPVSESSFWNARAKELGALAQQGTALDMAQLISQQHG